MPPSMKDFKTGWLMNSMDTAVDTKDSDMVRLMESKASRINFTAGCKLDISVDFSAAKVRFGPVF